MRRRTSRFCPQRGFTLIEVMVVVAVIALMTAMIIPTFVGLRTGTDLDKAKTCASLISAAKDVYLREQGQSGVTVWAAAATDADKFVLVRGFLGASGTTTLTAYVPSGYTVNVGALGQPVTLWQGATQIPFN